MAYHLLTPKRRSDAKAIYDDIRGETRTHKRDVTSIAEKIIYGQRRVEQIRAAQIRYDMIRGGKII